MNAQQPMSIPAWLPPIAYEAQFLYFETAKEKNPTKALEVLLQLIADEKMERVWKILYTKNHDKMTPGEFKYRGRVTSASIAADLRHKASELRKSGLSEDTREARILEFDAAINEEMQTSPFVELRKWSEQDLAIQLFLYRIYKSAVL